MTRGTNKSSHNIYEVLEPLSGAKQDLLEPEAMSLIKGMMTDQKREQNRRLLPDLTPVGLIEPDVEAQPVEANLEIVPVEPPRAAAPSASLSHVLRHVSRFRIGLFLLLCLLFFSGFFSTAMLFAAVFVLLFILIFGPEPVLDAFFPNWRTSAIDFGKLRFSAWGKR